MGECKITRYSTHKIVTWVGTGTDKGRNVTRQYNKGTAGYDSDKIACANVRRIFCNIWGTVKCPGDRRVCLGERCSVQTITRPSRGGGAPESSTNPNTGPNASGITRGQKTPEQKAKDEQYNKDKKAICSRECNNFFTDLGCYSAKWQYNCGGSTEFGDIIPDLCKDFPPPFNNCLLLGGLAVGAVVLIMLLK